MFQTKQTRSELIARLNENVVRVDLGSWLDWTNDGHGEHLHVVPEPEVGALHLYRNVGPAGENQQVKTTLHDVSLRFDLEQDDDEVLNWYICGGRADTLMVWLEAYLHAGGDRLRLSYYEDDGRTLFADKNMTSEALYLSFWTDRDEKRQVLLNKVYTTDNQMMARFREPRF